MYVLTAVHCDGDNNLNEDHFIAIAEDRDTLIDYARLLAKRVAIDRPDNGFTGVAEIFFASEDIPNDGRWCDKRCRYLIEKVVPLTKDGVEGESQLSYPPDFEADKAKVDKVQKALSSMAPPVPPIPSLINAFYKRYPGELRKVFEQVT